MELRLELRLSQKLVMTPQLQQAIKLLQLSRLELQQVLSQHLMENPLLEELSPEVEEGDVSPSEDGTQEKSEDSTQEKEGVSQSDGDPPLATGDAGPAEFSEPLSPEGWDTYYESDWRSGATEHPASQEDDFPSYEQTLTKPASLEDHLLWQLRLSSLNGRERSLGMLVIGNLDEDGYLRTPLDEIAADAQVPLEKVESVLNHVQTLDPPGVGARDLAECLMIQLRHLAQDPIGGGGPSHGKVQGSLLECIVTNHLRDLQKKRYQNIARELSVTLDEVSEAVHIIEGLEPKPGRPYFSDENHNIVPDVFVFKNEGEWVVLLNEDGVPKVRISPYYKRMMANENQDGGTTKAYLEDKLRGAQWIIRSIDQRNKTILKVVKSLVQFQEPFLEKGIQYLRPLVLRQVAEDVGMHESTISRVTTNKYMYCPQGMLELKFFFNAGIQRVAPGAEDMSSLTVRENIREMLARENADRPLKDQEIVARLRNRGIVIARRTVAKYRAELKIAPASQRKRNP
ncbi:MAG: RNA polymerase factor sigma-54 [Nitrospinae bacterium]|nr:RNA polymerase factor sigma-54 [Nitrospinota bacterium]